jgi:hypothetical protein
VVRGHDDMIEYVLQRPDVVAWLQEDGVDTVQYVNVDSTLAPVAHAGFIGAHAESLARHTSNKAHMSAILINKERTPKLGNVIEIYEDGRWVRAAVDYGINRELDTAVPYGDPSIRLYTLSTLPKAPPIPWAVDSSKEMDTVEGKKRIFKFETKSGDVPSDGIQLLLPSDTVFAPIKDVTGLDHGSRVPGAGGFPSVGALEDARAGSEVRKSRTSGARVAVGRRFHAGDAALQCAAQLGASPVPRARCRLSGQRRFPHGDRDSAHLSVPRNSWERG